MLEIHELDELLHAGGALSNTVVQGVTIPAGAVDWSTALVDGLIVLGGRFEDPIEAELARSRGALLFGDLANLPYDPYRPGLYGPDELAAASESDPNKTVDEAIYDHYVAQGRHRCDVGQALFQRLHDHAIGDALTDALEEMGAPPVVGVMGGHATRRDDPMYRVVAELTQQVAASGAMIATGGGPGSMEAANLGAFAQGLELGALHDVLDDLAAVATYGDPEHFSSAVAARSRLRDASTAARATPGSSLAIPTWFYGHEPTNVFATYVAKYFANALREDRLLAMADGGVIYTPGSAGTAQEVFQDGAQNHYETFGPAAPMVFVGVEHWLRNGVWQAITKQAEGRDYRAKLHLVDTTGDALAALGH